MRKLTLSFVLSTEVMANLVGAQSFNPNDVYAPPDGFITGSQFEAMPTEWQRRYLEGVMDGFLYAAMLTKNGYHDHKIIDQLDQCNAEVGMTDIQLLKIVDDYMGKHTDYWGAPMNGSALSAIAQFCKRLGHPLQ